MEYIPYFQNFGGGWETDQLWSGQATCYTPLNYCQPCSKASQPFCFYITNHQINTNMYLSSSNSTSLPLHPSTRADWDYGKHRSGQWSCTATRAWRTEAAPARNASGYCCGVEIPAEQVKEHFAASGIGCGGAQGVCRHHVGANLNVISTG